MRRLVRWVVDGLPFDPRSRRALDETLLDWAHEEASAATNARRWSVGLRALVAVARALVVSSVSEVGRVPLGWIAGRLTLFALLPAVTMSLVSVVPLPRFLEFGVRGAALFVLLLPGAVAACLPGALLLALAWRPSGRSVPAVGTAVVTTMAALALCGEIVPAANQLFGDQMFRLISESAVTGSGFSGNQAYEFSLVELVGQVASGHPFDAWRIGVLLNMTGLAAMAVVSVLVAGRLASRGGLVKRRWLVVVPCGYLLMWSLTGSLTRILLLFDVAPAICRGLAPWTWTALLLVAVFASRGPESADPASPADPADAAKPAGAGIL